MHLRSISSCSVLRFKTQLDIFLENIKNLPCLADDGHPVMAWLPIRCSKHKQPIGTNDGKVMFFGCVCFRGELGFLKCDDSCICVVNKQFQLLKFVFDYVYVDLQYDAISLTFTSG